MTSDWTAPYTPPPSTPTKPPRRPLWPIARNILIGLALLVLLPYFLVPLYTVITPPSTPMLWRWLTFQPVSRSVVTLDTVAPVVPLAVIAGEDGRFCTHGGVDFAEIREALDDAEDLSDLRGGSTITQQLVKNLFLWGGRSYVRKALEFPLALWTDVVLSKRRILELYLNVAEWGPDGEFGIDAGARRAFGKTARAITQREAALLVAVLPNPVRRDARRPGPGVRRIAGIYENRIASAPQADSCVKRRP